MRKTVNWEGDTPEGALFHVSGFGDDGIHVTDLWKTAEDFNNFVETRLKAGAAAAGIAGAPNVSIVPVHATFVPEPGQLS